MQVFEPVASIGAVAEHSIMRKFGAGRPDDEDRIELTAFSQKIIEKLAKEKYGNLAGLSQQYLFYWKREA